MTPRSFMLIAGDVSGDMLGAELVGALRERAGGGARFFGAGGAHMAAAGVEVICDFTRHAVFGLESLKRLFEFRRQFNDLLRVAEERRPAAVIGVDFGGFNIRFSGHVKAAAQKIPGWHPRTVQFVSPQVWASRPWRARRIARDVDLLLSIFPFERKWYADRNPELRVEFVGHPMVDRFAGLAPDRQRQRNEQTTIVFLPGSRPTELRRHLPVFIETLRRIQAAEPHVRALMVLSDRMAALAREMGLPSEFEVRPDLAPALAESDLAIAKSGTVTLECAFFRVPTVVMYKMSAPTYLLAKQVVNVKWVAMPNLLANDEVFPEFIQSAATPENLAAAALELMQDAARRNTVRAKLDAIAASLGQPGATRRAAEAILDLVEKTRASRAGQTIAAVKP